LLLCLAACAREFRPTLTPPSDIQPGDYASILDLWTRSDEAFNGVEHKLTAKATLITPMMRIAFQKRFPEVYGYGGQVTRQELRDTPAVQDGMLTFFVAIYAPNFRWIDLEKPDSIWHVTLQRAKSEKAAPDLEVDAKKIEKVKRDENLNTIFPYLGAFDTVYIVRFPAQLVDGKSFLRVRIASSFAESVMAWRVEP